MANLSVYDALQVRIGYQFQQLPLLLEALTHPSCAENTSYQRLEFLGDGVLGLLVAELLYQMYPAEAEGSLAKRHAGLVCGASVTAVAQSIRIGEAMRLGNSEEQNGGRTNASNLEDACEALIGALYLDGGLEAARAFVHAHWKEAARNVQSPPRDAKTRLQEWAQGQGLPLPVYTETARSGPAHAPQFTVQVDVVGHAAQSGTAASKRQAEQLAASAMLAAANGT